MWSYMSLKPFFFSLCAVTLALEGKPHGPVVKHGGATFHETESSLHIDSMDKTIIHWENFAIQASELVKFNLPGKHAAVLNRDLGEIPSEILGSLLSNGKVFLINKAGVIIGKDAVIDASSFIASSLDISDEHFLKEGDLIFKEGEGAVINYGTIQTAEGDVVLIGKVVKQEGKISSRSTLIGAGTEILLKPDGVERIFIRPSASLTQSPEGITQTGLIESIRTELKSDGSLYELAIHHQGDISALSRVEKDGRILLVADGGKIQIDGTAEAPGGYVAVLGNEIQIDGKIDVSSSGQGGTILVGGDLQGRNPSFQNAQINVISEHAQLKADSSVQGDGGKIIIWSDYATQFLGTLSAKGGPKGGNGGFIEVSGKFGLDFRGDASTLGPLGKTGTLLLDPSDITISIASTSPPFSPPTYNPTSASATLNTTELATALGSNNVLVETAGGTGGNGDIFVLNPLAYSSANTLTLKADNSIYVGAPISNSFLGGNTGNITLQGTSNIFIGQINATTVASQNVWVASHQGTTTVTSTNGSVFVGNPSLSANLTNQIGWFNSDVSNVITGAINVTAQLNVIVKGGDGSTTSFPFYGQIGHGAHQGSNLGIDADISVTATTGNIELYGSNTISVGDGAYALIGHGSFGNTISSQGMAGDITLQAPSGHLLLQSGSGDSFAFTQVGHCGSSAPLGPTMNLGVTDGDISITVGNGISIQASDESFGYSRIGHGGANYTFGDDVFGDITINNGPAAISLISGNGESAYTQIGHGGPNIDCSTTGTGHQVFGDITIISSQGNLSLTAGQDSTNSLTLINNYSQIGHGGTSFTTSDNQGIWNSDIFIDNNNSIILRSGNKEGNYAHIGVGGYTSAPNNISGNISITSNSGGVSLLSLQGFTGVDHGIGAYTQIGHGGSFVDVGGGLAATGPATGGMVGNIDIHCSGTILLNGGGVTPALNLNQNSPAQIGHGGASVSYSHVGAGGAIFQGDITLQNDKSSFTLVGGDGNLNGGAWIGHGVFGATPVQTFYTGSISLSSLDGSMNLTSGTTGTNIFTVIGNGLNQNIGNWTYAGNQQIVINSFISLYGGSGTNAFASISSRSGTQTIQTTSDSFGLTAGSGQNAHASVISNGLQTITAGKAIKAIGGTGASQTFSYVQNLLSTSSTTMTAQTSSVSFLNGSSNDRPSMIHSSTVPYAFTGAALTINAGRDITLCADLTTTGSNSITLNANTLADGLGSFKVDTATYNSIGVQIGPPTSGVTFSTSDGNITFSVTDRFANGSFADFMIGDTTDLSLSPLMPMTVFAIKGNVAINHYRDILLTSGNQGGVHGIDILLLADRNIQMTELALNPSKIDGVNNTLVVDNYFPTAPGIGTGFFSMTPNATISGQTKIFSASQSLNSISGSLDGFSYSAGPEFFDSNTERWGIYYPSAFFGGPGYTIFYKNSLGTLPIVPILIYQTLKASSQMFYDIRTYDDKQFWRTFLVAYNREGYLDQKSSQTLLSQWTTLFQKYQILNWWHNIFKEIPALDSLSSYEVGYNREFILQPRFKGFVK